MGGETITVARSWLRHRQLYIRHRSKRRPGLTFMGEDSLAPVVFFYFQSVKNQSDMVLMFFCVFDISVSRTWMSVERYLTVTVIRRHRLSRIN